MDSLIKEIEKRQAYDYDYFEQIDSSYHLEDNLFKNEESIKESLNNGNVALVSLDKMHGLFLCKKNYKLYYVMTPYNVPEDNPDGILRDEDLYFYEISIEEADKLILNYLKAIEISDKRIEEIETWIKKKSI